MRKQTMPTNLRFRKRQMYSERETVKKGHRRHYHKFQLKKWRTTKERHGSIASLPLLRKSDISCETLNKRMVHIQEPIASQSIQDQDKLEKSPSAEVLPCVFCHCKSKSAHIFIELVLHSKCSHPSMIKHVNWKYQANSGLTGWNYWKNIYSTARLTFQKAGKLTIRNKHKYDLNWLKKCHDYM